MRSALLRPALALAAIALLVTACSSSGSSAAPSAAGGASAAPMTAGPGGTISVTDAWARATPPGTTTSAAYFTLTNATGQDDALVSVSTPAAKTAEIHEVMTVSAAPAASDAGMGGGMTSAAPGGAMMGMQPIEKLPIPAGGSVTLKPGAYHVMLIDVATPLKEGDTIELTLTFEKAPQQVIQVPVKMG